jgi:peptidoglycan/xylan/chitin deacetylase (PgdA/CDA1 family)
MSHRGRGMDHPLYPYSAMPDRPPLHWPGGARVMANIVLYFEHWELNPPTGALRDARTRDPITDLFPAYRMYTWREYGNRVGVFRILDLLDRLKLPVTVAANGGACLRYPQLLRAFLDRGYEIAAHGGHASRMISSLMSEADERALIADAIDTVERAAGRRPIGWIGQDYGESTRTPGLVAEAGLQYLMDWPNDDQPYWMTVGDGLVSIPIQVEWEDTHALYNRKILPGRYPDLVNEAMDVLWDEGAQSGRYFGLHIHPWMMGKPHCFLHLQTALERLAARDGVAWSTAGEINAWMRAGTT